MKKIWIVVLLVTLFTPFVLAAEENSEVENVSVEKNKESASEKTLVDKVDLAIKKYISDEKNATRSIAVKIGSAIAPKGTMTEIASKKVSAIKGPAFTAAVEYYMYNEIFGLGLSYLDTINYKDIRKIYEDYNILFINLYLAVTPRVYKNDWLHLYPIMHIGVNSPFVNKDLAYSDVVRKHDVHHFNFYWGVGVGVEIKGFLVEAMYAVNYCREYLEFYSGFEEDNINSFAAYRLNVGYRFKI